MVEAKQGYNQVSIKAEGMKRTNAGEDTLQAQRFDVLAHDGRRNIAVETDEVGNEASDVRSSL